MIYSNSTSENLMHTMKTYPQDHLVIQSAVLKDRIENEKMSLSAHLLLLSSMLRVMEKNISAYGGTMKVDHSIIYRLIDCLNTDSTLTPEELERYKNLSATILKVDRELLMPLSRYTPDDFAFYIPWEIKTLVIGGVSLEVQMAMEHYDELRLEELQDDLYKEEGSVILNNGDFHAFKQRFESEFCQFHQELKTKNRNEIGKAS